MSELMSEEKPSIPIDSSLTLENVELRLATSEKIKKKRSKRSKSKSPHRSRSKAHKEPINKKDRRVNFDKQFVNEIYVESWKKYNSESFSQYNDDSKDDFDSSGKKKNSKCNCISCLLI